MQFMDAIGCIQTRRVVDWTNLLYFSYIYPQGAHKWKRRQKKHHLSLKYKAKDIAVFLLKYGKFEKKFVVNNSYLLDFCELAIVIYIMYP